MDYHPHNPDTEEKFDPFVEAAVGPKYYQRLIDCCYFAQCYKGCKQCCRSFKRCYKSCAAGDQNEIKRIKPKKPDTMADVPVSSSDSDDDSDLNDTYRGMGNASVFLGEGAVLYLQ